MKKDGSIGKILDFEKIKIIIWIKGGELSTRILDFKNPFLKTKSPIPVLYAYIKKANEKK